MLTGLPHPRTSQSILRIDQPVMTAISSDKVRLLLIDDHAALGDGLTLLFAQTGKFQPRRVAAHQPDFLEQVAHWQPQVAILAADLSGVRALDVLGQVRSKAPHCRVLLWSDVCGPGDVRAAQRAGAVGYLNRRIAFADLLLLVDRVLEGERVFNLSGPAPPEAPSEEGPSSDVKRLTPRELDVLCLLAQGLSLKQCAKLLERSVSTVDNHKCRLMRKLGLHSTVELTRFAIGQGLVQVAPTSS